MKQFYSSLVALLLTAQFSTAQTALTYNASVPNYVEIGTSMNTVLAGTNTLTAEGWCYLTAYPFLPTVVGNYGAGMQFLLRIDNTRAAFWVDNGSGFRVINGSTIIPLNTWTHIAGVWNGSDLKVYVNGVLDGTTTGVAGAFPTSSNPVRIGANQLSEAWTGKIDAVRIWSTARTVTEINTTMSSCLTGSESGLLALYNFEEGTGTSVHDGTGHGYTGTLMSSPAWTTGFNSGCSTLPVNFTSVSAVKNTNGVLVNWKVADEQDMLRYEVERSTDGRHFTLVGTVSATNNNSYDWLDITGLQNTFYYRIKSIDRPGVIKYTGIIKVAAGNDAATISLVPNFTQGKEVNLQFNNQPGGTYSIHVYDATGHLIVKKSVVHTGNNSMHTMQLPETVSTGFYQVAIMSPVKTVGVQKLYVHHGN